MDHENQATELIEALINAVEALQGMCGGEPPVSADHYEWVGCEVALNDAKAFINSRRTA